MPRETPDIVDDLLSLPFEADLNPWRFRRVIARAAAEIERLRESESRTRIDWERRLIINPDGTPWHPQPMQWAILESLLLNAGKVVSHHRLIHALYGDREDGGPEDASNGIKVQICRMRARLPWPIRNVHGVGYVLEGYTPPDNANQPPL
jgi:DNA-binding response OmpR family regulator